MKILNTLAISTFLLSSNAFASYLEVCDIKANLIQCQEDLCDVELLEMKIKPGSHGDYKCKELMKNPKQTIALKGQKPSQGECGLQYRYYNSRGPGGMIEGESWKVIKLTSEIK
jgi:hypothetical protein